MKKTLLFLICVLLGCQFGFAQDGKAYIDKLVYDMQALLPLKSGENSYITAFEYKDNALVQTVVMHNQKDFMDLYNSKQKQKTIKKTLINQYVTNEVLIETAVKLISMGSNLVYIYKLDKTSLSFTITITDEELLSAFEK